MHLVIFRWLCLRGFYGISRILVIYPSLFSRHTFQKLEGGDGAMHEVLLTLGFGIVTAAILALSAVAFTLEYGVTNVANVSHGEILTVSAYAAYLVHSRTGSALAAAIAAAVTGGLVALAMYLSVIGPFIRFGATPTVVFIATLGVSFIIQNFLV